MRLRITCTVQPNHRQLPYNHQYELSSWIYKRLASASPDFSEFLHERGLSLHQNTHHRQFKFFVFSNISVPKAPGNRPGKRAIYVGAEKVTFDVSFLLDEAVRYFVAGAFMATECNIGNRMDGKLATQVTGLEFLPNPDFSAGVASFQVISPLVVGRPVERNGRLSDTYLAPGDADYTHYFFQNLRRKYEVAVEHGLLPEVAIDWERLRFEPLARFPIKRKPRTLKTGRPDQQRVIGYQYGFRLEAPPELLYLGYTVGWGGRNAQGFGATKVLISEF